MIYLIEYDKAEDPYETIYDQIIIESPYDNCQELYKDFISNKAQSLGLAINSHWFNIMDYDKFHSHMSFNDFKKLSREYKTWFKEWSLINFILNTCEGKIVEHTTALQVTAI